MRGLDSDEGFQHNAEPKPCFLKGTYSHTEARGKFEQESDADRVVWRGIDLSTLPLCSFHSY